MVHQQYYLLTTLKVLKQCMCSCDTKLYMLHITDQVQQYITGNVGLIFVVTHQDGQVQAIKPLCLGNLTVVHKSRKADII